MRSMRYAAALFLFACGSSSNPSDGGTTNDGGALDAHPPPPVHAACAAPTITAGASFAVKSAQFGPPGIAWTGTEAAIVYYEGTDVKLQRLDGHGKIAGASITIGAAQTYQRLASLATDGSVYIACWGADEYVHCASISVATGVVTPGFDTQAWYPSLGGGVAYGPAGFVLAHNTHVQALNADGSARGDPAFLPRAVAEQPSIVATSSGYLVGLAGRVEVVRLDASLQIVGTTAYASSPGYYGLAASGEVAGIDWYDGTSASIQGVTTTTTGDAAPPSFTIGADAGCTNGGVLTSACGAPSSFAFTWLAADGTISYRAFDDQGAALGAPVSSPNIGGDCPYRYHTIIPVADGFLIAVSTGMIGNGVAVYYVGCP